MHAPLPTRHLFATLALLFATTPPALATCHITTPPSDWPANSARWDGACQADLAHGLGVLKEQRGATVQRIFFGRADQGELSLGVMELPNEGFVAGRFRQGQVLPTDDRPTLIKAFDEAAQAATAAADRFEKAGNAASAKFYRAKAKTLREQMD